MGQYQKALKLYNECLKTKEEILGVEYPTYLNTKNNIA